MPMTKHPTLWFDDVKNAIKQLFRLTFNNSIIRDITCFGNTFKNYFRARMTNNNIDIVSWLQINDIFMTKLFLFEPTNISDSKMFVN